MGKRGRDDEQSALISSPSTAGQSVRSLPSSVGRASVVGRVGLEVGVQGPSLPERPADFKPPRGRPPRKLPSQGRAGGDVDPRSREPTAGGPKSWPGWRSRVQGSPKEGAAKVRSQKPYLGPAPSAWSAPDATTSSVRMSNGPASPSRCRCRAPVTRVVLARPSWGRSPRQPCVALDRGRRCA